MLEWLNGKKTYVLCAGAILVTAGTYLQGGVGLEDAVRQIFEACIAATIRHGISTGA